ncbi:MAG: ABC transporter permease, partial [Desulfovibrionaceae bacterium]
MFLNLKIALKSLAVHKVRTILAMLGIFLGALAFTGVQHVSRIMVRSAEMEVEKMGPNLFAVVSGQVRFRRSGGIRFTGSSRTFSVSDGRALAEQVPSVLDYTPITSVTGTVRAGAQATSANIIGCWPSYQDIRSFHPAQGRFFTDAEVRDAARVCVLGSEIAARLFGDAAQAIGQNIFYYRASFRVLGVMESKGTDLSGVNQDEQLFMPLSTYMRRAANQDWVLGVYLHLADGADMNAVKDAVRSVLRRRHHIRQGKADDFSLLEPKETIELQRQALDLMWTLGVISSTISFAVGGLGILSIMVLMVRTRRLEIGIRR